MNQKQEKGNIQIGLDLEIIKKIPFDKYDKDFTFIINCKQYKTSRFVADVLSPIILRSHFSDKTINEFYIETNNYQEGNEDNHDFNEILSFASFESKNVEEKDKEYYISIFYALGNESMYQKIKPTLDSELNLDNFLERIKEKEDFYNKISNIKSGFNKESLQNNDLAHKFKNTDIIKFIEEEIKFISSHFYEIDRKVIKKLNTRYIFEILKQHNLKIESEDELLDIINDIYLERGGEEEDNLHEDEFSVKNLYEYVFFDFLSSQKLREFKEIIEFKDLTPKIWESIIDRAVNAERKEPSKESSERYKSKCKIFKIIENREFEGIIRHLTEETGGNIHDNGTIEVTSNSICGSCHPKKLLDFNENGYYTANGYNGARVCFDFKDRRVKLTNYSIKSYSSGANGPHLKSWTIEVSNDGQTWKKIDEHKDCQTLNGPRITGTFEVQPNDFSRYIRLNQTDGTWGSGYYLYIYYIEFYGFLQEK